MYKKVTDRLLTLEDFNCPVGMHLDASNRWVQKAAIVPWNTIEDRYARLFPGKKGVVAKPLRIALGALIIQKTLGCSDRELAEQIKENPCLQYFIGLSGYAYKEPFASSLLVEFRKRLTAEILGEINELIISNNQPESPAPPSGSGKTKSLNKERGANHGTLALDATCAPQNIAFPQDASLLNTASGVLSRSQSWDADNTRFVKILEPGIKRPQGILWNKNKYMTQAALIFRDFIVNYYKENPFGL